MSERTDRNSSDSGKALAMATEYFKIAGGTVYDPANGIDGQVRDIWIAGSKIVEPPTDPEIRPDRDHRCPRAGRHARRRRHALPHRGPQGQHRARCAPNKNGGASRSAAPAYTHSGTMGSVPSTFATGYKYAGMGYTTAFDAAIPPLSARHAHEEFADTPCIDKGFYILMGNNHYLMRSIQQGEPREGQGARSAGSCLRRSRMPPSSSIPAASRSGRAIRPATSTPSIRPSTTSA